MNAKDLISSEKILRSRKATKITKVVLKPKQERQSKFEYTTAKKIEKCKEQNPDRKSILKASKRNPLTRTQTAFDRTKKTSTETQTNFFAESIVTETLFVAQAVKSGVNSEIKTAIDYGENSVGSVVLAIENNETFNWSTIIANREDISESATVNAQHLVATSTPLTSSKISGNLLRSGKNSSMHPTSPKTSCAQNNKHKSYDPVKARVFIKRQQIKRKEALAKQMEGQVERTEIKKRLLNLQKNSLKIVEKNVKRARTKTIDSDVFDHNKITQNSMNSRKGHLTALNPFNRATKQLQQNKENSPAYINKQTNNDTTRTDRKRIGILRRLSDNENSGDVLPLSLHAEKNSPATTNSREISIEQQSLPANIEKESVGPAIVEFVTNELMLKAPESMILKSSFLPHHEFPEKKEDKSQSVVSRDEIPFWLRPTPVQPYPYNFILAVRKKLESITHPIINHQNKTSTVLPGATGQLGPDKTINKSVSILDLQYSAKPSYTSKYKCKAVVLPPRIADYKSISQSNDTEAPIKNNDSQNTLSLSSGILSHSSPKKRNQVTTDEENNLFHTTNPSPLSTDMVDGMHISTSENGVPNERIIEQRNFIASHINFERGTDIQKMLNDFNESLSQVIEVNKKLHHALSNPPLQRESKSSSMAYSDDFEDENQEKEGKTNVTATIYSTHPRERPLESVSDEFQQLTNNSCITHNRLQSTITESVTMQKSPIAISFNENTNSLESFTIWSDRDKRSTFSEEQSERQTIESISVIDDEDIICAMTESATIKSASRIQHNKDTVKSFQQHFSNDPEILNTSIGSDLMAVFNQASMQLSDKLNSTASWAEENISYSNLGMFERLIQSETQKSNHLLELLRLREKLLIDRFKGQIVWLELRKQKMKEQGQTAEIITIKKKQRALLLRLQNERNEIHRLVEQKKEPLMDTSSVHYKIAHLSTNMSIRRTSADNKSFFNQNQAMKAMELKPGNSLEKLLQRREDDLRSRRIQVEKLLNWHEQLDKEEIELRKMEKILMLFSSKDSSQYRNVQSSILNAKQSLKITPKQRKGTDAIQSTNIVTNNGNRTKKHLRHIEDGMKALQDISSRSLFSKTSGEGSVKTTGKELNRLWKRLTGQTESKYEPCTIYMLNTKDLEVFYENAKQAVLKKFTETKYLKILDSPSLIDDRDNRFRGVLNTSEVQETVDTEAKDNPTAFEELKSHHQSSHVEEKIKSLSSMQDLMATDHKEDLFTHNQGYSCKPIEKETQLNTSFSPDISQSNNSGLSEQTEQITYSIINTTEQPSKESCPKEILNNIISAQNPEIDDIHSDIHSDITEDSLNNVQSLSSKTLSIPASTTNQDNSLVSDNIHMVTEIDQSDIMLNDVSFPHLNVTSVVMSREYQVDDQDTSRSHEIENRYAPDKAALTKNSEATNSKNNTMDGSIMMDSRSPSPRSRSPSLTHELEQRLINLDDSLKELREAISRSPVLEIVNTEEKLPLTSDESIEELEFSNSPTEENKENIVTNISTGKGVKLDDFTSVQVLPTKIDIKIRGKKINEGFPLGEVFPKSSDLDSSVEVTSQNVLRVKSLQTDNDSKHVEQNVAYPLIREIPNKPPPPYPQHRLPIAPILPSIEYIKELVFTRIEQLYYGILNNTEHLADTTNVMSPTLTQPVINVYNSIFLDICAEFMAEFKQQQKYSGHVFKQPLACYNPPNRLIYLQECVVARIFKLLGLQLGSAAARSVIQSSCNKSTPVAFVMVNNRRKRDLVDEVLIQELVEDECKWTNFDVEEIEIQNNGSEIIALVVDESVENEIVSAADKQISD